MKKFIKDSYCDVRGWDKELIHKAAEMMAKDLGTVVWENSIALQLEGDFYVLRPDCRDGEVGLFYPKSGKEVTKKEVEQMIKEREEVVVSTVKLTNDNTFVGTAKIQNSEERVIPLEETGQGIGVTYPHSAGDSGNTLTKLRKAQEDLLQAEQNYTNASEALDTAEKAHTEALEAFRKEAVGLLGESCKTSSASSQEDMGDIENWKRGDLLFCRNTDSDGGITPGKIYVYIERSPFFPNMARVVNDQGRVEGYPVGHGLAWHSRPSKD